MTSASRRIAGALAALAIALVVAPHAWAQGPGPAVIMVSGDAVQHVPADSAALWIAWQLRNGEIPAQQAEDAAALDSLRALLRRAGVSSPQLHVTGREWFHFIGPEDPEQPRDRRREVTVYVSGARQVVNVAAALRNHPVFREVLPQYACTCRDSAELLAYQEAFEASRHRARALAAAAGLRITGVAAISTTPYGLQATSGYATVPGEQPIDPHVVPLRPPTPGRDEDPLAAPLVQVMGVVYVTWRVEGQ